jgi:Cupin
LVFPVASGIDVGDENFLKVFIVVALEAYKFCRGIGADAFQKISSNVFSQGTLCGQHAFEIEPGKAHIHIIKKAPLEITFKGNQKFVVVEPSIVFFPRPTEHVFTSLDEHGADMVCAKVSIGNGLQNPLILGFPDLLVIPVSKMTGFEVVFKFKNKGFKGFDTGGAALTTSQTA